MSYEEDSERLLRRAGLEPVGFVSEVAGLDPDAAWQLVINLDVKPAEVIDYEKSFEVDRRWWYYASRNGLLSEDDTFVISYSGEGTAGQPWVVARKVGETQLAEAFAVNSGEPEFVTASNDGKVVCGVTSEEGGIWIVVVLRTSEGE